MVAQRKSRCSAPAPSGKTVAERLLPQHVADLRHSGLNDGTILAAEVYSVTDPEKIAEYLGWDKPATSLGPCLAFRYCDVAGRRTGFARLKPDNPRNDKDGKPCKYESPRGRGVRIYFAPTQNPKIYGDAAVEIVIIEGEKKCLAVVQAGVPCIGIAGTECWSEKRPKDENGKACGPRELHRHFKLVALKGRKVVLLFDSDVATNDNVQRAELQFAEALTKEGAKVFIARIPPGPNGEKVGADDFIVAHGEDKFRKLIADAVPAEQLAKPIIVCSPDELRVNDAACKALARLPDLYNRGNCLVRIAKAPPDAPPRWNRPASPRIIPLVPATLQECLAAVAFWVKVEKDGVTVTRCHPPKWSVDAIFNRGLWPVREIRGIVAWPTFRPDGTLIDQAGFDAETGLFYHPAGPVKPIPANPTRDQLVKAGELVREAVCDFPFVGAAHESAWLAALLSVLARPLITGAIPLFVFEASVHGSGKTLLTDVIATIVGGSVFPKTTYTSNGDEFRKRLTSLAVAGNPVFVIDNASGLVDCQELAAAITSGIWSDRLLGGNKMLTCPWDAVTFISMNNGTLSTELCRRTIPCRLEPQRPDPENRKDFKHPNLLRWVRENRDEILAAALTLIRGFIAAGQPEQGLTPLGSFESWGRIGRDVLVWLGMPDPAEARSALGDSDPTPAAIATLAEAWLSAKGTHAAINPRAFLVWLDQQPMDISNAVRGAMDVLMKEPKPSAIGYAIRKYRGRVLLNGLKFVQRGRTCKGGTDWDVIKV